MHDSQADAQSLLPESRNVISANLPEPVVVLSVVLAIAGLVAGALALTVICVVFLLIVFVARVFARVSLTGIDITRSLSSRRVFVGDELQVELVLENRKTLPLPWLNLNFTVPDGLRVGGDADFGDAPEGVQFGRTFIETFSLQRFERLRARRSLLAQKRGCYRLGAVAVESGDLFGFYASHGTTQTHHEELVVMPVPQPLPGFSLPAKHHVGSRHGRVHFYEDLSRPGGVREYQHGDPLNRLDWKSTARQGSPVVRVYDPGTAHAVLVMLDTRTSHDGWRFLPHYLESAVAAAASVCVHAHEAGQQVGLLTNGLPANNTKPAILPASGGAHLDALMLALARVQATTPVALEALYEDYVAPRLRHGTALSVVHVTALPDGPTYDWFAGLHHRGCSTCRVYVGEPQAGVSGDRASDGVPCYNYTHLFSHAARAKRRDESTIHA